MLAYRTRRRLALVALLVAMPLYILVAVSLVNWADARFGRMPIWAEFAAYVGLGLLWILPLRPIFRGVGQADPAAAPSDGSKDDRRPPPE